MLVVYRVDVFGYGCVVCCGSVDYVCGCCDVDDVYGDA